MYQLRVRLQPATMAKTSASKSSKRSKKVPSAPSVVSVSLAGSSTLQELYDTLQGQCGWSTPIQVLCGYPPRPLEASTLVTLEACTEIQPQDSLVVREVVAAAANAESNNPSGNDASSSKRKRPNGATTVAQDKNNNNDGDDGRKDEKGENSMETNRSRRPRRAAAEAARESLPEAIRQQEAMQKEEASSTTRKKRSSPSVPKPTAVRNSSTSSSFSATTAGRRLGDGATVPASSSSRASGGRRRGSASVPAFSSKDDVSVGLLESIQSGGGTGGIHRILRKAMNSAVLQSYEQSKAVARLSAVQDSGTYQRQGRNISFPKGLQGRGNYVDEDIELLSRELLQAVITAVYTSQADDNDDDEGNNTADKTTTTGREMLRPRNVAQLSPRVFWSLVYCRRSGNGDVDDDEDHSTVPPRLDLVEALHYICPGLDWSYLQQSGAGRSRTLSTKAKENARQARVAKSTVASTTNQDPDAGLQAIEAVQEAMERAHETQRQVARERAAQAAASRASSSSSSSNVDDWDITVTPTELDHDELRHCLGEQDGNDDKIREALVTQFRIHNWRELANVSDEDAQVMATHLDTSLERVQGWIEAAQVASLEEIMLEILSGEEDLFGVLRKEAKAGTPRDLVHWKDGPELLLELLKSSEGGASVSTVAASSASSSSSTPPDITVQDIQRWCDRSQRALDAMEWLHWYATPIDD